LKTDEAAALEILPGDTIEMTASLEEVRPPANQGQLDMRLYLARFGTLVTAYCDAPERCQVLEKGGAAYWRWIAMARRHLTSVLGSRLPPGLRELAVSVVYGDKITDLPEEIQDEFRRAGLTHILVASGTQVSLLIGLMALCFWRPGDNRTLRGLLGNLASFSVSALLISFYAAVAGFETSIIRALAMGLLLLGGRALSREADGVSALALSGFVMVALNPAELMSPGFQLSFMATFGLIYASGALFPRLSALGRWPRLILAALITTGGAQVFVLPLLMGWFNQLSLTSLVSNLIAIPLAFLLLITGGVYSLGIASIPLLGPALGAVIFALSAALRWVADLFAGLPLSKINVPSPPWWWVAAWYSLIFLIGERIKHGPPDDLAWRRWHTGATVALAGGLAIASAGWLTLPRPGIRALALAPGWGEVAREAYVWQDARGRTAVFARGGGLDKQHNGEKLADALASQGVNRVDALVWLDGVAPDPADCHLPSPTLVPTGGDLPTGAQLGWIECGGIPCGVECGLGCSRCWIVWEPAALEAVGRRELAGCESLVVASQTWRAVSTRQRSLIRREAGRVLIQGGDADWARRAKEFRGETIVGTEAQLRAAGENVLVFEYVPSG
jgi:ComEC/Rec2-related protein